MDNIETDHTLAVFCVLLSFVIGLVMVYYGTLIYAGIAMIVALGFFVYAKSIEDFVVVGLGEV